MNTLLVGHVAAFTLAALACLGSIPRARTIQHPGTRQGLTALLATSGVWSGTHVGYLLVPSRLGSEAFYVLGLVAGLAAVGAWLYFAAAYTGRDPRRTPYRTVAIGLFVLLVALKVTNPWHQLYFTATQVTTPFPHLAIQHGIGHWLALGISYSLSSIGFFILLERFYFAGTKTRPLVGLVALTALPVGLNVVGTFDERLISVTYEPLGVALFAIGVLFVYTERFQTVQLVGDIEDPVVFLDSGGRIRDFSREASRIFPGLEGAYGQPLETVVPRLADCLETDRLFERDQGEETRLYRVSSAPFLTGETQTGQSLVISDVTEAERYRQNIEQKNEQLEALNRVVRHDIRNDMSVVLAWSEVLEGHVDDDGEDALERLQTAAEHTVELTQIAREFVDSLAGAGVPELKPVALDSYLRTELEQRRDAYQHAEFHVDGELPAVSVRANELLSSVFRNLLNNAVQHSDKGTPVVTVTTETDDRTVRVRIADNGPGIADERKDEIFGKEEKGLDSEGTGIGLYLVKTLVEQYGGEVWVEDNEPRGAVFVVELPQAPDDAESQSLRTPAATETNFGT
jgi:signal transduction histidine kinase